MFYGIYPRKTSYDFEIIRKQRLFDLKLSTTMDGKVSKCLWKVSAGFLIYFSYPDVLTARYVIKRRSMAPSNIPMLWKFLTSIFFYLK